VSEALPVVLLLSLSTVAALAQCLEIGSGCAVAAFRDRYYVINFWLMIAETLTRLMLTIGA